MSKTFKFRKKYSKIRKNEDGYKIPRHQPYKRDQRVKKVKEYETATVQKD